MILTQHTTLDGHDVGGERLGLRVFAFIRV